MRILHEIRKKAHFRITEKFDVSKLAGFEFTSYFTKQNMESEDSYIALTSKNIQTERIELKDFIKIDKKVANINLTRSKLFKNDIVLSYTGEYRRSLVLFESNYQLGPNVCRIRPKKDKDISFYVSTFFNSKIGQIILDKEKTLSAQPTVAMSRIREIPIPYFEKLIIEIKHLISNKYNLVQKSLLVYSKAEKILFEEIGLLNFNLSQDPINIKSFKDSFGVTKRLDAEYYQKKFEQIIKKIVTQKHDILNNIVDITKSIEPGSNHYSEEVGLPFYRVSDYNKFGLSKPDKELTNSFVSDNKDLIEKLKPKKGTILFSKDGSVGTAYLLREDLDGITSGAILHLKVKNSKEILPEYLTLALNSKLVQMQAERDAGGSIILHWRKEEIEQVVVPIIDFKKQEQIAELVEESFKLKTESERLLEVAKKAVEIAIEVDEKTAIKFINDNI
jgi:type I restriction enzyme S subunit